MRLIKTSSRSDGHLETEEFQGTNRPLYAILSHTWSDGEVLFADLKHPDVVRRKKGYSKIQLMLRQAAQDGIPYAWVDTCCINKDSSAELSEAINAMYDWYRTAIVCYAYLEDVATIEEPHGPDVFTESRWFRRGWTLQELLGPRNVFFYGQRWAKLGEKLSLIELLETASGISRDYLTGERSIGSASIAKRMSWAARRVTTREEDIAYFLLGIFDVNMPMLYGEGSKAFIRLQEEIMRGDDDQTLFAWKESSQNAQIPDQCGLLAPSPAAFAQTGDMVPYAMPLFIPQRGRTSLGPTTQRPVSHTMMNKGLYIELNATSDVTALQPENHHSADFRAISAVLDCTREGEDGYFAIALRPTGESVDHFARWKADELMQVGAPPDFKRSIYVRQRETGMKRATAPFHYIQFKGWYVENLRTRYDELDIVETAMSLNRQGNEATYYDKIGDQGVRAGPTLSGILYEQSFILLIGSDKSWNLAFDVWENDSTTNKHEDAAIWTSFRNLAQQQRAQKAMPPSLQMRFDAKPAGTRMNLEHCTAVVEIEVEPRDEHPLPEHVARRDRIRAIRVQLRPKRKMQEETRLKASFGVFSKLRGTS